MPVFWLSSSQPSTQGMAFLCPGFTTLIRAAGGLYGQELEVDMSALQALICKEHLGYMLSCLFCFVFFFGVGILKVPMPKAQACDKKEGRWYPKVLSPRLYT